MRPCQSLSQIGWRVWACWCLLSVCFASSLVAAEDAGKTNGSSQVFEVHKVLDVPYYQGADADPKHKLDLYLPKDQKDFPVLFFVHGGAWKSGDRKIYGRLGEMFARNGIGTVIPSYRLSPKVVHPAHIQDVAEAFAWTVKNINTYGG